VGAGRSARPSRWRRSRTSSAHPAWWDERKRAEPANPLVRRRLGIQAIERIQCVGDREPFPGSAGNHAGAEAVGEQVPQRFIGRFRGGTVSSSGPVRIGESTVMVSQLPGRKRVRPGRRGGSVQSSTSVHRAPGRRRSASSSRRCGRIVSAAIGRPRAGALEGEIARLSSMWDPRHGGATTGDPHPGASPASERDDRARLRTRASRFRTTSHRWSPSPPHPDP